MCQEMETNKWLWQPHKKGPISLRVSYRDQKGETKYFTKSLKTSNWAQSRKIRDTEFTPIILDIDWARAKLELIHKKFPELEQQLQEGVHGGYGEKQKTDTFTLDELYNEWCREIRRKNSNFQVADRTASRYKTICNQYVLHVGPDKPIRSITTEDTSSFRDKRLTEDSKSKKTVSLELNAVRNLFSYAVEKHGLKENPAQGVSVKMTKTERKRTKNGKSRRPPSYEEADKICYEFPGGDHKTYSRDDFQDYAMIARYTGLRQGEIAHLRTDDFRLCDEKQYFDIALNNPKQHLRQFNGKIPDGSVLCIYIRDSEDRTTKTGEERLVPVADKLLPTVKQRIENASGKNLFPFAVKDSGASFGRTWLKRVKKIDEELTMHGFRHYCTSEMENNGVSTSVSHIVVGHDPGTVHEGYFHKALRSLKEAVDKIY